MKAPASRLLLLTLLAGVVLLQGCTPVAAWERGTLARPEMGMRPDPLDAALQDHVHFSKEASSGSNSQSGGGCGCN